MPKVVFLCKGTRGDVLPLLGIALQLLKESLVKIELVCSPCVLDDHMRQVLKQERVDVTHFPEDKIDKWPKKSVKRDMGGEKEEGEEDSEVEKEMDEEDRQRLKLLRDEFEVSLKACSGADLILYNLFALEGHFIAQHIKIASIAMSPHLQMRPLPSSFKAKMSRTYPALYQRLIDNSGTSTGPEVNMAEVEHWMWRMFLDDYGTVCDSLGLPVLPFSLDDTEKKGSLPPPTPLLYGLSPVILPRQPWWPNSVHLCGFWRVPPHFYPDPHPTVVDLLQRLHAPPIYVGYGSMESFLLDMDWTPFLTTLQQVMEKLKLFAVLQCKEEGRISKAFYRISQELDRIHILTKVVSHEWLFTRCLAILHHGGTGTVVTALDCTKPQIISPVMFDQNMWAEQLAWLGVAYRCPPPSEMTAKELYRAIEYVKDKSIQERITDLKKSMEDENGLRMATDIVKQTLDRGIIK